MRCTRKSAARSTMIGSARRIGRRNLSLSTKGYKFPNKRIPRLEGDVTELKETAAFNALILKALVGKFEIVTEDM